MKVAISLPDDLSRAVDAYARRHRMSRSNVLATGARKLLAAELGAAAATQAWNRALAAPSAGDEEERALRLLKAKSKAAVRRRNRW